MLAAADARVFSCDYDPPSPEHMAVASPESFIGIGRRLGAERIPGLIIIVGLAGDSEGVPCERVREALLEKYVVTVPDPVLALPGARP